MDYEFPYLKDTNPGSISPLALAYIGDAVYEVFVRAYVLNRANMPVNKLHRAATKYVSAQAQSRIMNVVEPFLSDEELSVYKRGRNAHSHTSAKNADIVDYRRATGLEALVGFLFIKKSYDRINELINIAFRIDNEDKQ